MRLTKKLAVLLFMMLCGSSLYATQWMAGNESNICDTCDQPPAVYLHLAEANVTVVRYFVYWSRTNPASGVYDWTQTDREINAMQAAGIAVYANFMWAPAWATEGKPAYEQYTAGCSAWNDPKDGSKGIHFAWDEHDYCRNVPHIDGNALRAYLIAFINRYGTKIRYWGIWNEPMIDTYFPAKVGGKDAPSDLARYVDELVIPFVHTIREKVPGATIVGPEAAGYYDLEYALRRERDSGEKWFDVISFHPYPWADDYTYAGGDWRLAALHRVDGEFKSAYDLYGTGRPAWASEFGAQPTETDAVQFCIDLQSRTWVKLLCFHLISEWFLPGTYPNGPYTGSVLWDYMKTTTNSSVTKRRAVAPHSRARMVRMEK